MTAALPLVSRLERLDLAALLALVRGAALAVRVRGFFDGDACRAIAERLARHPARSRYETGPHIGRLGPVYFDATTAEARQRYFNDAEAWTTALREACLPRSFPIDTLRVCLGEVWPGGARVERLDGLEMFAGLARFFDIGPGARPHQDVLAWDAPPGAVGASDLVAQLSANIHLQPSQAGGDLELWSSGLDRDAYEAAKIPGAVALERARLPASALVIEPEVGELILFDSNRLHAVRPIRSGTRITLSCFIGARAESAPLGLWS